jgi:hypothetical protein
VGQEDDQVERRGVGPVQVLEDDQQRVAAARPNSSAIVSWNIRSCEPAACPSACGNAPSGRRASTNG